MLAATSLKVEFELGNARIAIRACKLERPDTREPVYLAADRIWQTIGATRMDAQRVPSDDVGGECCVSEYDGAPEVKIVGAHQHRDGNVRAVGLMNAIPDDGAFGGIGEIIEPRGNESEQSRIVGCVSDKLVEWRSVNGDYEMRFGAELGRQHFGAN